MPTRELNDTEGYSWDLTDTASFGSSIVQGDFAFHFGATLSVSGNYFNGTFGTDELAGRQLVVTGTLAGLDVTRRFYVPNLAGEAWGRFFDSLTNNTGAAITVRVLLESNSAADSSTVIVATESGNQLLGTDDDWVITDGPTAPGTTDYVPHVLYLFGDGSRAPDAVTTSVHLSSGYEGIGYHYDLTIAPGETASLLYFISQQRDGAAELRQELRGLARLDTEALAGLTTDQLATVVNWDVSAAPDEAILNTFNNDLTSFVTPGGGWGDGNGGGYFGQTFIAEGNAIDEIRFHLTEWENVGGPGGITDFKLVVTEWVNGRPGAILGTSDLLFRSDAEGVSDRRGVYIVTFDDLRVMAGQTYAFMVDANYGTLTTGRGGYEVESNNPYAGGSLFYNVSGAPTDYGSVTVRSSYDLSFRIAFADLPLPPAAPILANPIADYSSPEDILVTYQIPSSAFSDANDDDLTYSATLANGDPLPAWLIFVPSTRTFSGQPPMQFSGTLSLRVTASDGSGSASDVFDLIITPVNDQPYVFLPIPDQASVADVPISFAFDIQAFADHENTPLTYTATLEGGADLPTWLAFDGATRTFSGLPPTGLTGIIAITVTASDGELEISDTFDLTIVGNTPSVARPDAFTIGDSAVLTGNLLANNGFGADSDVDSPVESVRLVGGSRASIGQFFTLASGARLRVNADGTFTYDTNGAYTSLAAAGSGAVNTQATETFTYTLENGSTATVTIRINGVDNADFLQGTAASETLLGGVMDDTLMGGMGADSLIGGSGTDTASYADDFGAVFVNLTLGVGSGNAAAGDVYTSIENVIGSSFNDTIIGENGVNVLDGRGGDDVLIGSLGADVLIGGSGSDTASYGDNQGSVFVNLSLGRGFNNAAEGDTYNGIENLQGSVFDDYLLGDDADNRLDGGMGADVLYGFGGADTFVFRNAASATSDFGGANVDTIADFVSGVDKIELSQAAYGALSLGTLSSSAFTTGTAATSGDHRIVYNSATGQLYYDADGSGAGAAVLFAVLDTKPAITATDFIIAA